MIKRYNLDQISHYGDFKITLSLLYTQKIEKFYVILNIKGQEKDKKNFK